MFQDEHSPFIDQPMFQNKIRDLFETLQLIRRIGKDKVVIFRAPGNEFQHIVAQQMDGLLQLQLLNDRGDKGIMDMVHFDTGDIAASSRSKFEGDATGPCKKIQNFGLFKIYPVVQNVEQVFLGKVSGRPGLKILSGVEEPPLHFAANYSHL